MTKLDDKAREIGLAIQKGPTKYSGHRLKRLNVPKQAAVKSNQARKDTVDHLIDDDEALQDEYDSQIDEFPIGSDFKWSLAEIEDWLDAYAADIAAGRVKASDEDDAEPEVETSAKLAKVKPPSKQKLGAALRRHEHAAEIRAMAKSAKVVVQQSVPTLHDLNLEVRALKSREAFDPNWTDVGGHTINENDEADGGHALREYRESVERENRNLIPPDPAWTPEAAMPMPTDIADVAVVKVKRRVYRKL
jgi:hypothetical protein